MRIPISDVRCDTEYAVTAYRPTADRTSAMPAKIANIDPNTRIGHRICASRASIVWMSNSGRSGSTIRISSRTSGVIVPGSPVVRTTSTENRCGSARYGR